MATPRLVGALARSRDRNHFGDGVDILYNNAGISMPPTTTYSHRRGRVDGPYQAVNAKGNFCV